MAPNHELFIAMLRAVADDLNRYAQQIQDTHRSDLMGELEPPPDYLSVEVQGMIFKELFK